MNFFMKKNINGKKIIRAHMKNLAIGFEPSHSKQNFSNCHTPLLISIGTTKTLTEFYLL